MIDTTSKLSLKMSCLRACSNDVKQARELYDFIAEGIGTIPDFDPVVPSTFEQVKTGAADIFAWISEHREDVAQGVSFIQSLKGKGAATPHAADVPPIPNL